MHPWTRTRAIDAPAERLWTLLTHTARWPDWGPSVRDVRGPAVIHPGAQGAVRLPLGVWVPFEIERFEADDPACRRWTWRVAGIPATGHRVEALGSARCAVTFTVPGWAPVYLAVCERALRRLERLALNARFGDAPGSSAPAR